MTEIVFFCFVIESVLVLRVHIDANVFQMQTKCENSGKIGYEISSNTLIS